jgi:HAD superfamily hydrolase (TIGR01509 family)
VKEYILFDNDGVLVETERWYYEASIQALGELGVELNFQEYMEVMTHGGGVWGKALDMGIAQSSIDEARSRRNRYYQEYLQTKELAIEGVHETLHTLSKHFKMAIVTTSRRVYFEIIHKNRGIVEFMDFVLCEGEYPRAKPHPDPYLKGLDIFNAQKEQTIIVEDSQRGLKSALLAQIECVIVHNDFTKTQDFSKADYRINTITDLPKLFNL